jgi:hypothetical protein
MLLLWSSGCKDQDSISSVGRPEITVSPQEVVFPSISVGQEVEALVNVQNNGTGTLVVSDWRWTGNNGQLSVTGLDGLRLEPREDRDLILTFSPTDATPLNARLTLVSNDPNRPELSIRIRSVAQASRMVVTPPEVNLVAEQPGLVVQQTVTIRNVGSDQLNLSRLELVARQPELSLTHPSLPVALGPDQELELTVAYAPLDTGVDTDQILVGCDAVDCEEGFFFIPVNAQTQAPRLTLLPPDVTFGSVEPNPSPVPTRTLTALNDGSGILNIERIRWIPNPEDNLMEFSIVQIGGEPWDEGRTEGWLLAAGESLDMEIAYNQQDNLPDLELLEFTSNDFGLPTQVVRVAGRGAAPEMEVTPMRLEFPLTARNRRVSRSVTIRNVGVQPLEMDGITPVGGGFSGGVFSLVNAAAMPPTLAPGEEFVLQVEFSPTVADIAYAGTIYITNNNDPVREEARVDVTGLSAGDPVCRIRALPGELNFGTVPRGSRRELVGRLRNDGSSDCQIQSAVLQTGSLGFVFSNFFRLESVRNAGGAAAPFLLAPGEEAFVTASYFPTRITELSDVFGDRASIEVRVQDVENPGTPVRCGVAPSGFGAPPRDCGINLVARSAVASIGVIPGNVNAGQVTLGCNSQTQTVRVYNTGGADVEISNIGLEDCTGEFVLAGVPVLPLTVRRGDSFPFSIRYRPLDEGIDECRIVVESSSEGGRTVVPVRGEGVTFSRTVERFEQVTGRKVDVLFIVDNSGSMGEEQSNLRQNFSSFVASARTWGTDLHLGVVTTQTDGTIPSPGGGNRNPGELVGNPRIVTTRTPGWESVFSTNVNVGISNSSASASERGLESAYLALSDPPITDFGTPCTSDADCGGEPYACVAGVDNGPRACGGFNRTFLREDASLELVFLSDEEDQSRAPVTFYVDFFKNIKGFRNTSLFHASAIVGDTPRGCSSPNGEADAGFRYLEVVNATGGEFGSICDRSFANVLRDIGNRAFGLRVDFFLSRVADRATVQVFNLNGCGAGATRTGPATGWTFDPAANSILWNAGSVPQPGRCFEVEYEAACF